MTKALKPVPLPLIKRLFQQGLSERAITQYLVDQGFNCSRSTIHRRLLCCTSKSYEPKPRRARLSPRARRALSRLIRVHNCRSAPLLHKELAKMDINVSCSTILQVLHNDPHLVLRRPKKKPFCTAVQAKARLDWAKSADFDWKGVYFGDEKMFQLDGPAWRPRMWCDKRDPFPILPRRGQYQAKVVFFGCFSMNNVPDLVQIGPMYKSADYCMAVGASLTKGSIYLHDRHPVHCSRETALFLSSHGIHTELFPPKDADINPIENLWGVVAERLYVGSKTYNNADSLCNAIKAVWSDIQKDRTLRVNLVNSMPRRLACVIANKGWFGKY
jgi:hypothetical protein